MQSVSDTGVRIVFGDTDGALSGHARAGDQDLSVSLASLTTLVGDAATLSGFAVGSDDRLLGWANGAANVFGDAYKLTGLSRGGSDEVRAEGQYGTRAYGDAEVMHGRAVGGDDEVSVASNVDPRAYGDARLMTGETIGGNDTVSGGGASHASASLYGDGERLEGASRGGDDVLFAYADAQLWGDAEFVGPLASRGADRFVIQPSLWGSQVMDFEPGKDVIELRGFAATDFEDLLRRIVATPDGLLIDFGDDGLSSVGLRGVARDQLSERDFVLTRLADPGAYGDASAAYGAGWYHALTPASQDFIGHPGERDIYIRDFGLYDLSSEARPQGFDRIDSFELGLDEIITLNSGFVQDEDNRNAIVSRELQQAPSGEVFALAFYQDMVVDGVQTITEVPGRLTIDAFVF